MSFRWLKQLVNNQTVLALSSARFVDALGNSMLIILIPLYVAELPSHIIALPEPALVGILIALFGIIAAFLQPLMGSLADRAGRHKLFVQIGLLLMGLGIFAFTIATRFTDLLVIRLLQGVGISMTLPTSMALMAMATAKSTRGGSMGVYSTFRLTGFALGPLLGGYMHVHYGFNDAFYVATALVFLGILMVQLWVREGKPKASPKKGKYSLRLLDPSALTPEILGLTTATFVMANAFAIISPLENEFNARLDQTALGFGAAFSALMISRLLLQIPLGRLSDRIGRKPLVVTGLLLMVPATALLGSVTTTLELVGLRFLQGMASAGVAAPAFALAADLTTQGDEGQQMSLMTASFSLGIASGPLMAGFLAAASFTLPFLIGGFMCLIGAWAVYQFVPETIVQTVQD